jgi:hemoglobin-like flavoprotein
MSIMGDQRSLSGRAAGQPASVDTLDAHTITLVQTSWARVMPIADAAATLFYERLFALDPSVKPLFKTDMREQKKKLMQTLSVAVDGLRNLPRLVPVLEELGARHAGYMVQDRHYELVGQSLLWTLGEGLGDDFTPEIEAAWRRVYGVVAGVMRRATAGQGAPEPCEDTMPSMPALPPGAESVWAGTIEPARPPVNPQAARGPSAPAMRAPDARTPGAQARDAQIPDTRMPDAPTIDLVQASWARVMPISDAVATLFYDRLFALDPSIRTLFKSDMREQKKKLMQTLSVAVDGLRTPDRLVPVLQTLGMRHTGYMVEERHYDLLGDALLWTLREGLGDAFTPAIETAWKRTYGFIAVVMKQAAAAPRAATAAEEKLTVHYPMPGPAAEPPAARPRPAAPAPAQPAPVALAPAAPAFSVTTPPAPAAPAFSVTTAPAMAAPSAVVLPVASANGTLDVRLTFANPPAPLAAGPARGASDGAASAILLAVTCGTLVVLLATAVLFGLHTLGGIAVVPAGVAYAVPLALMGMAVVVFFLGYWWGRRSARKA